MYNNCTKPSRKSPRNNCFTYFEGQVLLVQGVLDRTLKSDLNWCPLTSRYTHSSHVANPPMSPQKVSPNSRVPESLHLFSLAKSLPPNIKHPPTGVYYYGEEITKQAKATHPTDCTWWRHKPRTRLQTGGWFPGSPTPVS